MNIIDIIDCTLSQVRFYLERLDNERYTQPLEVFSYSTTGQHTRHIIEFFQCLLVQSPDGVVNYDRRIRNKSIEEDLHTALHAIDTIIENLHYADLKQSLILQQGYGECEKNMIEVSTTFERELVYNIEHAIHHMAMIKIGLRAVAPEIILPESFGVAPSTVRHQHTEKPIGIHSH